MLKYWLIAAVLRAFSANASTRRLYRRLGNALGARTRIRRGLPDSYVRRARWILDVLTQHDIARQGAELLELGTGWLQWESTVIRLWRDVRITLYDVWDNRQLPAAQHYFAQLAARLSELPLPPEREPRARELLAGIAAARSFDELYRLLGFRYVVEPSGALTQFPDASFDAVFSCNVLEHVDAAILPAYVRDMARLLKPGGYAVHTIDPGDHLAYYCRGVSKKNYVRYSEPTWRRWYANDVQYFNRVQRSTWLRLFQEAGLELAHEEVTRTDISRLPVAPAFAPLDPADLACTGFKVIYRKPA